MRPQCLTRARTPRPNSAPQLCLLDYPFFSHQRPFRCCVPITYPPITPLSATAQLPNTDVPCLFRGNALMTAEDTVEDLSR